MLHELRRSYKTIRHLKPSQAWYMIVRRVMGHHKVQPVRAPECDFRPAAERPCTVSGIFVDQTTFRFLNVGVSLGQSIAEIDWCPETASRLWRYNLHYFDFLREADRPESDKAELVDSWIASHAPGSNPGWEPFPTSLRIVNWIQFMQECKVERLPAAWLDSLYTQSLWLSQNLEKHILANHYFENIKALLFAACVFDSRESRRWRSFALTSVREQLREQTLADGAHYERSPQYHCLMLENYLDLYGLAMAYPDRFPVAYRDELRTVACKSLDWLADVVHANGTIPLFNDSTFGAGPGPELLFDYANALFSYIRPPKQEHSFVTRRRESGIYGWCSSSDSIRFTCGNISPSYQPGHTHCDMSSYELMLSGQCVLVDSGVYEYAAGEMRDYVRSTLAHNTVAVGGAEQSEVWSAFRIGQRAVVRSADIVETQSGAEFSATIEGFRSLGRGIRHTRIASIDLSFDRRSIRRLLIRDEVFGVGRHNVLSFIHVHPDVEVVASDDRALELRRDGEILAWCKVHGGHGYSIDPGYYCPDFGDRRANKVIVLASCAELPVTLSYEIQVVGDRECVAASIE